MLDRFAPGALYQRGRFVGPLPSIDVSGICNSDEVAPCGPTDYIYELEVTQAPRKVLSVTSPDGREVLRIEALGYSIDRS